MQAGQPTNTVSASGPDPVLWTTVPQAHDAQRLADRRPGDAQVESQVALRRHPIADPEPVGGQVGLDAIKHLFVGAGAGHQRRSSNPGAGDHP